MSGAFRIRPMTRSEIDLALDWAADEGWNPGLHDADGFHAADPGGFLLGLLDGEPVASISAVRYGADFGFFGFYIVRPPYRGRGYGLRLWQAGVQRLADRTIGLDGVVAQQDNYRRSDFVYAHGNQRYRGIARGGTPQGLTPVHDVPFAQLLDYDTRCFGCPRPAFLRRWLQPPAGTALAVRDDERLLGYGVIRACRQGHKVGPLFADNAEVAQALMQGLAATVANETVFLDVPLPNAAALALAHRHDMEPVFETARMYRGEAPAIPVDSVFGVTTFELG